MIEESELAYRNALRLDPNSAKIANGLAVLLHSYQHEYVESEQLYLHSIALDPRDSVTHLNYAMLLKVNW
jgi:cytochrome c-type biogenesis protein CcmH/NrfG